MAPTDALGVLAYFTDTYLFGPFGIDNLIAPYVQEIIASLPSSAESVDVSPVSRPGRGTRPQRVHARRVAACRRYRPGLLDPVIDGLLNSGLSLF